MTKNKVITVIVVVFVQTSPLILDKLPALIQALKETPQLVEKEPPQSPEKN